MIFTHDSARLLCYNLAREMCQAHTLQGFEKGGYIVKKIPIEFWHEVRLLVLFVCNQLQSIFCGCIEQ